MRGFGSLFLAAFFLANAGFTVVLTRCTMAEAVPGMACCCGDAGMCGSVETPLAPGQHALTASQPCQSASVIGGNMVDPTIVAREFTGLRILKVDLLAGAVRGSDPGQHLDFSPFSFSVAASNTSPPSVETYVLNSTFRI